MEKIQKLLIVFISMFVFSCVDRGAEISDKDGENIVTVDDGKIQYIAEKKIYFGHQSVGENIINGVKNIEGGDKINVVNTSNGQDFVGPIFAHSRIGKNSDPKSKINEFIEILKGGVGNKVDIAFVKLCYVDIDANTNVKDLFVYYKNNIDLIQNQFPNIKIIHFTVPLKTVKISWKAHVKNFIGKKNVWELQDNIKRNEYNNLVFAEYGQTGSVFDLAKIESTLEDGKRQSFKHDGKVYYSLVNQYSNDGGHLNEKGQNVVAKSLVAFLAESN